MIQDFFTCLGLAVLATVLTFDAMPEIAWLLPLTAIAIALIIYIEVKRAYQKAKRERDREDLRRHTTEYEDSQ